MEAMEPSWRFPLCFRPRQLSFGLLVKKQSPIDQRKSSARPGQRRNVDDRLPATNPLGMYWKTTLRNLFGVDPRSLAVFRMAMAALLLAELAIRAADLNAMYTDAGMFSRAEICRLATTI